MSVRSGSSTPWREWDGSLGPGAAGDLVYVRDGTLVGDKGLLAEALRADGIASGLGWGYRLAEEADLVPGHYGYVEDARSPTACDDAGMTNDGELVTRAMPCVFAVLAAGE
jgi:hypothetical protein